MARQRKAQGLPVDQAILQKLLIVRFDYDYVIIADVARQRKAQGLPVDQAILQKVADCAILLCNHCPLVM